MTIRLNDETQHKLDELSKRFSSRSAAVTAAIDYAWRELRAEQLRAESADIAADPDDQAELRAVASEMDEISAW
ncbi:hypothetical protein [Haloechinothrix salitolerans]|uniref:Ribbon-helix-helix protein, copG family n=2 Tax=Haloechinothrix salitolerans TaxID=926830 RepID=A0ABW2BYA9_9PSEU